MKYEIVDNMNHYVADDGFCFIIRGQDDVNSYIEEIWLSNSDKIENYVEVKICEQTETQSE